MQPAAKGRIKEWFDLQHHVRFHIKNAQEIDRTLTASAGLNWTISSTWGVGFFPNQKQWEHMINQNVNVTMRHSL